MFFRQQFARARGRIDEVGVRVVLIVVVGLAVIAVVGAQHPLSVFRRRDGFQLLVGKLDQPVLGNGVSGHEGTVAIARGAQLLRRLQVIVLVRPKIDDGLFLVRVGRGIILLFGRGKRATEIHMLTIY